MLFSTALGHSQFYNTTPRGSSGSGDMWGTIIVIIIVVAFVFLVCRELMCWYYKINKIIELMEEQNNILRRQIGISSNDVIPSSDHVPYDWLCKKCNSINQGVALFCHNCGEKNDKLV